MPTYAYKLTPKQPDPVTAQVVPLIGWHFVGNATDAMKVFSSWKGVLARAGWHYHLDEHPGDPTLQRMSLTKQIGLGPGPVQLRVEDTQWYVFVGTSDFMQVLDEADVTANYDVTDYVIPDPPQQQQ